MISARAFGRLRPWGLLFVVLATALALVGAFRLKFDDSYRNLFRSTDPRYVFMERVAEVFGSDDQLVVLLFDGTDVLSAQAIVAERAVQRRLFEIEAIESVYSILNVRRRAAGPFESVPLIPGNGSLTAREREEVLTNPLVADRLVSRDGRTTAMFVRLAADVQDVDRIAPVLEEIRTLTAAVLPPLRVEVTGLPAMRVEIVRGVERDQVRFNLLGIGAALLVSFVLFRRPGPLVIAAAGPLIGVVWTLGLLGWLGEPVNPLNNVVPQLILVIGFTDSSHYLFHIARARTRGLGPLDAAVESLNQLAPACALTMATTAIGFLPLALADVQVLRRFGLACAAGSALSFLAVLTVVPLLSSSRLGARLASGGRQPAMAWLERLALPTLGSARWVAAAGVVVFALLVAGALRLQPDYRYRENLPPDNEAYLAMERGDAAFGGVTPVHVVVEWPVGEHFDSPATLAVLREVESVLEADELIGPPMSLLNLLRAFARDPEGDLTSGRRYLGALPPEVREQWLRSDLRTARVTASVPDAGAATLAPRFADLEGRLAEVARRFPGFSLRLSGMAVVSAQTSLEMISSLGQGLGAAALGIFAIIALGTRSLRLGVISILPNVFPLAGTACVLYLADLPLQYISAASFCICLGLATDDSIHFLSAFKRSLGEGQSVDGAVRESLRTVGAVMITTSLLLATGFATLLTSGLPTVRRFGALSCAILVFSIAGDLFLMPALLRLGIRGADRRP